MSVPRENDGTIAKKNQQRKNVKKQQKRKLRVQQQSTDPVSPLSVRLESQYSITNGSTPNGDEQCKEFIASILCNPEDYDFEFGKDGQPFYISGPYDHAIQPSLLLPT